MKPNNPFLVYGYIDPTYFCDREKETEKIISALQNERNLTLIAPRRMGKTGLIKNVFYQMKREQEQEAAYFYMDIYSTRDLKAFIQLLAKTVLGELDTLSQTILRQMTGFFKSCRPIISADERSGMPTVSLDFIPERAEQTLKEIFDYMTASRKRCYLAIDEFQQIMEYPEKGIEALLRSHIQFMPNVHFIFSGSKKHVMEEMFASAKRPFYQSTQIIVLKEIPEEKYYSFAQSFFTKEKQDLPKETFSYLYHLENGHTWYIQSILNRLYEKKAPKITDNLVDDCVSDILDELETIYQSNLTLLTNNQIDLLKAVATEGVVKSINANDFLKKYHLKTPSSVNVALKSLLNKELLYNTPEGYIVYDRFFGKWLKDTVI
ncbi:AAA family ATPase [Bacteroides ovatus]|uniref:Predicted ATPase, AAA+ ATPase superfamily n=1 Tax=Bacteroides ovatus TaxID=28116 RepID=A0A1G8CQS5_BACOV|nr:ATP-binding protein [Bacteroides ovatus]SDH47877.1 Predicted ATPase, AAA+ ATPase superfamily [Bacteroides ovatus]